MRETLEKKLQEVRQTISFLAPRADLDQLPVPAIKFEEVPGPHYNGKELILPISYSQGHAIDLAFKHGKAAGLVMLYHQNEDLRPVIGKGALNSERLSVDEFAKYCFWSNLAMAYVGLSCLMHRYDRHIANQRAEVCRCALEKSESEWDARQCAGNSSAAFFEGDRAEYAALVAVNYAGQLFLKHRDQWLSGLLEMHRVHEIHNIVRVNENFDRFISKKWD